jgi:hypothetical protein
MTASATRRGDAGGGTFVGASAIASSLRCEARLLRDWVFCSFATSRNVMMLMTSCQVSTVGSAQIVGIQATTTSTQSAKNEGVETHSPV